MKATITSTSTIVDLDKAGTIKARVWEGVTENGIAFTAYIPYVQVRGSADNAEFERDLEHKPPEPSTQRAIDMRMIL